MKAIGGAVIFLLAVTISLAGALLLVLKVNNITHPQQQGHYEVQNPFATHAVSQPAPPPPPPPPLPPLQTITVQMRPGQQWELQNSAQIQEFDVRAQWPVNVTEAGCQWFNVVHAHFHCDDAADVAIIDVRPKLALFAPLNVVTIRYRSWGEPQ